MHTPDKKKNNTAKELVIGGGIVVAMLPIILMAFIGGLMALVIGGMMMVVTSPENRLSFMLMIAVYGVMFSTISWLLWRIFQRTAFLTHRLWGLNREHKRIETLSQVQQAEMRLSADFIHDLLYDDDVDVSQYGRRS